MKTKIIFGIAALSALCACSDKVAENNLTGNASATGNIVICAQGDPATKTSLDPNGKSILWSAGDALGIYMDDGSGLNPLPSSLYSTTAGGATASTFTGGLSWSSAGTGTTTFYGYHTAGLTAPAADPAAVPLTIPAAQTQVNNSAAQFGATNFMVAEPLSVTAPAGQLSMKFHNILSTMEFRVAVLGSTNDLVIQSVTLSDPTGVAKLAVDGATVDVTKPFGAGFAPIAGGTPHSSVTLTVTGGTAVPTTASSTLTVDPATAADPAQLFPLTLTICPADCSTTTMTISIVTNKGTFTFNKPGANFVAGKKYVSGLVINPNAFTKIIYGNNLGLAPAENYANQFRFATATEATAYFASPLIPTTDIPSGKTAVWSLRRNAWLPAATFTNVTIDPATGGLTMPFFSAGNSTFIVVTATVGKGTPEEFSVSVPVFFSYIKNVASATSVTDAGKSMIFTPFVAKINPLKGGSSAVPQLVGGLPTDQLITAYRRTFRFIDLKNYDYTLTTTLPTPQSQDAVTPNIALDLWTRYYATIGKTLNNVAPNPVTYADNSANPGVALCYASPADGHVIVNPGKFVDGSGQPLNGIFIGQMPYATDGTAATLTTNGGLTDYQIFPLLLWFDEKF